MDELLTEYFKIFPNSYLFPEWYNASDEDKKNMLKEAIKDKKHISETKTFQKYQEEIKH